MDQKQKISFALYALAETTRLDTYRLLSEYEPDGLAAREIARTLKVPQNTMTTHLRILAAAGLLTSGRRGRLVVYRAKLAALKDLTLFLTKDCCSGNSRICAPLSHSSAAAPEDDRMTTA